MRTAVIISVVLSTLALTGCNKEEDERLGAYEVRMADSPADYSEVNIEVTAVEARNSQGEWVELGTNAGVYNLLELTNGTDVVIAKGYIWEASVDRLRFTFGSGNTVTKRDGETHNLAMASSRMEVAVGESEARKRDRTSNRIVCDIDVATSISESGGSYAFNGRARTFDPATEAQISGTLVPSTVAYIHITDESGRRYNTYSASNGNFVVRGLQAGNYSLTIETALGVEIDFGSTIALGAGEARFLGQISVEGGL